MEVSCNEKIILRQSRRELISEIYTMRPLFSIILPLYHQSDQIQTIIENYQRELNITKSSYELLLVVNGNDRKSYNIAKELTKNKSHIHVFYISESGWGNAVLYGIKKAKGKFVCYTNSARTRMKDLLLCLRLASKNPNALVKTARVSHINPLRKIGSRLYNAECHLLLHTATRDINSTPKIISHTLIKKIHTVSKDDLIDAEIIAKCRKLQIPVLEIPIVSPSRISGKSTTNYFSALKMYWGVFRIKKLVRQFGNDRNILPFYTTNMFYFISIFLFLIAQFLLVVTTHIRILPEMYFYPWLITQHVFPYRDFFINHGFALYLLLSPLTFDKSVLSFKIFFVLIQELNVLLVLLIVKKYLYKLGILFAGVFYITISFFVTENQLWDEVFLATVSLLLFYIVKSSKKISWIGGVLVSFMFFDKPTGLVFLIPLLLFKRDKKILFSFLIAIAAGFLYLLYNHAIPGYINNVFLYNLFYGKYFIGSVRNLYAQHFFYVIYFLIGLLTLASILGRKFMNSLQELCFLAAGYIFMLPNPDFIHSVPFISLFTVYATSVIVSSRKYIKVSLVIFFIVFYFGFLYRKVKYDYVNAFPRAVSYIDSRTPANIILYLQKNNIHVKRVYVFGNELDNYFLMNKLPITGYFMLYPWVSDVYTNIEKETLLNIGKYDVNVVIVTKPLDISYVNMHQLVRYIHSHYTQVVNTKDYEIYVKK